MEYRKFVSKYILRIDKGEEVVETLKKFCKEHNIKLGIITVLGTTNMVTIGLLKHSQKSISQKS